MTSYLTLVEAARSGDTKTLSGQSSNDINMAIEYIVKHHPDDARAVDHLLNATAISGVRDDVRKGTVAFRVRAAAEAMGDANIDINQVTNANVVDIVSPFIDVAALSTIRRDGLESIMAPSDRAQGPLPRSRKLRDVERYVDVIMWAYFSSHPYTRRTLPQWLPDAIFEWFRTDRLLSVRGVLAANEDEIIGLDRLQWQAVAYEAARRDFESFLLIWRYAQKQHTDQLPFIMALVVHPPETLRDYVNFLWFRIATPNDPTFIDAFPRVITDAIAQFKNENAVLLLDLTRHYRTIDRAFFEHLFAEIGRQHDEAALANLITTFRNNIETFDEPLQLNDADYTEHKKRLIQIGFPNREVVFLDAAPASSSAPKTSANHSNDNDNLLSVLERLPLDTLRVILVESGRIFPQNLSLSSTLRRQLAQLHETPSFWRDLTRRCFPLVTRLPFDAQHLLDEGFLGRGEQARARAWREHLWRIVFLLSRYTLGTEDTFGNVHENTLTRDYQTCEQVTKEFSTGLPIISQNARWILRFGYDKRTFSAPRGTFDDNYWINITPITIRIRPRLLDDAAVERLIEVTYTFIQPLPEPQLLAPSVDVGVAALGLGSTVPDGTLERTNTLAEVRQYVERVTGGWTKSIVRYQYDDREITILLRPSEDTRNEEVELREVLAPDTTRIRVNALMF